MKPDPVIVQARQLSSGTISYLTGKKRYDEIDPIRVDFVEFCKTLPEGCDTWQKAWARFRGWPAG